MITKKKGQRFRDSFKKTKILKKVYKIKILNKIKKPNMSNKIFCMYNK